MYLVEDCVLLNESPVGVVGLEREDEVSVVLFRNDGGCGEKQKPVKQYFLYHFVRRGIRP
jgi:hypothetical protein